MPTSPIVEAIRSKELEEQSEAFLMYCHPNIRDMARKALPSLINLSIITILDVVKEEIRRTKMPTTYMCSYPSGGVCHIEHLNGSPNCNSLIVGEKELGFNKGLSNAIQLITDVKEQLKDNK